MRTAGYQLGRHCNRPGNNVAQLCEKEETDFKIRIWELRLKILDEGMKIREESGWCRLKT